MQPGTSEHKAQVCQDLIKTYHENIFKDELYLMQLEQVKGNKRKEIVQLDMKLEVATGNTKDEREARKAADKAKFVAEQELKHIEQEIRTVTDKVQNLWPERIRLVEEYLERN
jgi:uncharacterized protein (DUF3084 family)